LYHFSQSSAAAVPPTVDPARWHGLSETVTSPVQPSEWKYHLNNWGPRDEHDAVNRFATIAQAIIDTCQNGSEGAKKE
jgi:hypothetical protein